MRPETPDLSRLSAYPRTTIRKRRRRTTIAPRQLRLIGDRAMIEAIRETGIHRASAEMEIGFARMAERPLADTIVEIEQAGLARDIGRRLCRHQAPRRRRRNRRLL